MVCSAYRVIAAFFTPARPVLAESGSTSPRVLLAVGRLGFSTDDSQSSFQIEFDVGEPPAFNALADFMLTELHNGCGRLADSLFKFNAPFAPRPTTSCIPVS